MEIGLHFSAALTGFNKLMLRERKKKKKSFVYFPGYYNLLLNVTCTTQISTFFVNKAHCVYACLS